MNSLEFFEKQIDTLYERVRCKRMLTGFATSNR